MMHKQQNRIDMAGSFVAIACAVHCIALPIIISFGGLGLLNSVSHGTVEMSFLLATILFAGSSIFIGFRQKRISTLPVVLFIIGFFAICTSLVLHLHLLSAIGGILIAAAHYFNWKYTRQSKVKA
jgi:hypothetical protein